MKISVVTISYNQARFLGACMDSVLRQEYGDVEYIVVDPGSTDGSRDIITECGDRITAVFEPDRGPADGLNRGFARATGEIFGFVNADDMLLPGALTTVARAFDARPEVDVLTGCGYFIDSAGRLRRRVVPSKVSPWLLAHGAVTVFQQGMFFRRAAFERAGGFNPKNPILWDGELLLDMALGGAHIAKLDADVGLFRLHGASITGGGGHSAANRVYTAELERLFLKATGRRRRRADRVVGGLARLAKLVCDPDYLTARLCAAIDWKRRSRRRGRV